MDAQKVDMYLMANSENLPPMKVPFIREKLLALPDDKFSSLQYLNLKNPTTALLLSIIPSLFCICGIDRFYMGDVGLGVLKLITFGGCGIWAIIDWFLVMNATKEDNAAKLLQLI